MPTAPHPPGNRPARRRRLPRSRPVQALAAVLVLIVLGAACSSNDSADDSATDTAEASATFESAEDAADDAEGGEGLEAEEGDIGLADESRQDADLPTQGSVPTDQTAATGERIIKEGTVTVEVDPGQFDGAFGQIISRAQALGGHVAGSSSSIDDEGLVSGQVTIRIPVRNFEDLLTVLGEAGEVVDRNITSQDVTEEFTDLEARRRNLQAQETFYLRLLDEAASVNDAIAVQQQLQNIQGQIEQITGRLNLLENRSSFSTLTVRIRELGADGIDAIEDGSGFAGYVETARETLLGTLGALLIAFTFALPFLVLSLMGYGIYRVARRRREVPTPPHHAAAPPAPIHEGPSQDEPVEVDV